MTVVRTALAALTFAAVQAAAACGQAEPVEERFVVLAGDETTGYVRATINDDRADVSYMTRNNGRGPTLEHHITVDAAGIPTAWQVEGTTLFGAAVDERFILSDGQASWSSQADEDEVSAPDPAVYVANDDTPWSLSVYARALLNAPDQTLPALPGGVMTLTEVRENTLGEGDEAITATTYRLDGLDLEPSYFMLDEDHRLLAAFSGGLVVREGWEEEVRALDSLPRELDRDRYRELAGELAHRFDAPVRIRNVRVFDARSGDVGAPSDVVISGEEIVAIEPYDPSNLQTYEYAIDGEGGVLVPGLHDMHSHLSRRSALFYLAAGVTATRNQGSDNASLDRMLVEIETGDLIGPRVVRNGMLEGTSDDNIQLGIVASTLEEALDAVRWYSSHGYWQIKIYNSLHPEWVAPVIHEAHRLGMTVTGHIPAFAHPDEAIEAGYADIAHVNQLMLGWLLEPGEDTRGPLRLTGMARAADLDLDSDRVRHTIDLMKEHDVALDTTAVTLELLMLSRAREIPPTHAYNFDHMPVAYQRYRRRTFVPLEEDGDDARYRAAFQRILDTLLVLHEEGIQLLPGTDDSTGFTVHREMELYVEAGLTPAEALAYGTLKAEEYFGRDQQLGTIERGKLADFFLIPNDPTENISAIREGRLTMVGGVAYLPSDIYEALGVAPFIDPVEIQPPQDPEDDEGEADAL
ncbi:MAG: amidohydrolase family protein [Maricaulaceae bacterium]|jgi:hypothetical protein